MDAANQLKEAFQNEIVDSWEMLSLAEMADLVVEIEYRSDVEFSDAQLIRIYREAAESAVDSIQANERQRGAEANQGTIDRWEALRPKNRRRAHIQTLSDQA